MTPERWKRVENLYEEALARDPAERSPFLLAACGADAELRREVESLLAFDDEDSSDASPSAPTSPAVTAAPAIGARLDHYRIHEKIGAGGMGEVYRAHDEQLGRDVAIKVLSMGQVDDPIARARLVREARTASRLNHPNICIIHEVGEADGHIYIAMELIKGETLSALLARGPLSPEQILRYAMQLADAMAHAHSNDVVHRDFKSANVIITPEARAKVLDFGLARRVTARGAEASNQSLTAPNRLIGTAAYMAPEQVRGERADFRSDVWALGVVLHEMACGRSPFVGAHILETLDNIAKRKPARLPSRVPFQLQRVVDKCLDKKPDRRYPSGADVLADLRQTFEHTTRLRFLFDRTGLLVLRRLVPRERRAAYLFAALMAVLAIAVPLTRTGYLNTIVSSPPGTISPATRPASLVPRRSVAVLGFQNLSGRADDGWMSTAMAEMLTAEVGAGEILRVIAGEEVSRFKTELGIVQGETLARDTLANLRGSLGADFVVLGSYLFVPAQEPRMRLVINLQDTEKGETVQTITVTGTRDRILELISEVGGQLRAKLGVTVASIVAENRLRTRLPQDPQAFQLYAEGLQYLRSSDFIRARERLSDAAAREPTHPLIPAALAEAWSGLGYDQRAQEQAAVAAKLATNLPREDRLFVEARDHEMSKRWERAIDTYQLLYDFFPDNVEYGLRLARVLFMSGRPVDALDRIEALKLVPVASGQAARIYLAEAAAAQAVSDYKRQLAAASTAAEKGLAVGASLSVAHARVYQATALLRLGQRGAASTAAATARDLFASAGDRSGQAGAIDRLANIEYEQGHYGSAASLFEKAVALWRATGNVNGIATGLNNVADSLMMQDELSSARALFEEALTLTRQSGSRDIESLVLINLGDIAFRQGNVDGGRTMANQALNVSSDIPDYSRQMALHLLGRISLAGADTQSAERLFRQGMDLPRDAGDRYYVASFLFQLGETAAAALDLRAARQWYEQALNLQRQLGNDTEAAESHVALALLSIAERTPERHAAELADSLKVFADRRLTSRECHTQAVLGMVALARGQLVEANRARAAAERLLPALENVYDRLWTTIQIAMIRAAGGEKARALSFLKEVDAEAARLELALLERAAERAIGEVGGRPKAPAI